MSAAMIIGAGDATGAAIARAFAAQGLTACISRRPRSHAALKALAADICATGHQALPFPCDARDEASVVQLFETVERDVGPIEVCVFNIGANVQFPITETTARV